MAGAIDINDVDWASNSDAEVGGGIGAAGMAGMAGIAGVAGASGVGATAGPPPALPPMINIAMEPAPAPARAQRQAPSAAAVAAATGSARTGGGAVSGVAAALATTSVARAVPPPLFTASTNSAAPSTRGSRNLRTSPFNLKACSACKKGRASAIKCRDRGPHGENPGSPTNAATAAAAAVALEAALANRPAGPRAARAEAPPVVSTSSLLTHMLGTAALPAPVPAPPPPAPILAPRVAPGAPVVGGGGLKRPRCLARGCNNAVARDVAFCSDDCIVAAQKEAVVALLAYHGKQQKRGGRPAAAAAAAGRITTGGGGGGGGGGAGGGGGDAMVAKQEATGSSLTASASSSAAASAAAGPKWTEQDEQRFSKGLEAVRARVKATAALRFRHKVMDRFRELFAEGMAELGLGSTDAVVLSGVLAWDLEHELHAFSRTNRGVYKEKAQSLRFNIKFAKNPELFK
ncbi:unnamed protein product, partial [Laminaria digitata]